VTVGSPEKAEFCRELGADVVIDYKQQDFAAEMKAIGATADVILDIIGAKYLEANVSVLSTAGRLVVIGMQGGVKAELNLGALMSKRAAVMATTLRARPSTEKAAIVRAMVAQVWPLISDGTVRPIIHATYALDDVRQAHQVLEESSHIGKVLLTP
jgi:NADPH:quinone reductase-like Zn-dependent oxidoreductase